MTPEEIEALAQDIIEHTPNDVDPQDHADDLIDAQIEWDSDMVTTRHDDEDDEDEDSLDTLFDL